VFLDQHLAEGMRQSFMGEPWMPSISRIFPRAGPAIMAVMFNMACPEVQGTSGLVGLSSGGHLSNEKENSTRMDALSL